MRPAYITATRSASPATTDRSWVIQIRAISRSRRRRCISWRICAWMVTSRAVVGSSAMMRSGACSMAMAMTTRWRHASGELVGVGAQPLLRRWDPHEPERIPRPPPRRVATHVGMSPDRLDHLGVDAQHRVQGHHGILEDHGDARPAQPGERRLSGGDEVPAVEDDPARGDPARLVDEADHGEARDRLAGSRLSDQAEDLAAPQAQVDAVHRPHHPRPRGEFGVQPLDAQQLAARNAHRVAPAALTRGRSARSSRRRTLGAHRCSLGLRMSRSSSPTRLMATTVISSATPGKTLIHG